MRERRLNKEQYKKLSKRFEIEKINRCESCKYFFNSFCLKLNKTQYKNQTSCFMYANNTGEIK